jgi:Na+-driven multidrug efflux pump
MPRCTLYRIVLYVTALTLLVLAGTFILGGFEGLSGHGIGALIVGVAISFALGVGLMVLMYASSREHDETAHRAAREGFKDVLDRKPPEER